MIDYSEQAPSNWQRKRRRSPKAETHPGLLLRQRASATTTKDAAVLAHPNLTEIQTTQPETILSTSWSARARSSHQASLDEGDEQGFRNPPVPAALQRERRRVCLTDVHGWVAESWMRLRLRILPNRAHLASHHSIYYEVKTNIPQKNCFQAPNSSQIRGVQTTRLLSLQRRIS